MAFRASSKIIIILIILCITAFSVHAQKEIFPDSDLLDVEEAFAIDHIVIGPNEAIVRWEISENYYLYKDKFVFSSKDFFIDQIQFPPAVMKYDEFFGLSEVYYNVVETTLMLTPKNKAKTKGVLEVSFQGCWGGGVCYPPTKSSLNISGL